MGFFDRLYYGKAGKRDYTEMDMPKTRASLFFLVFKDHIFDLIKVNLMQVIFWIPFLIWTMMNLMVIQSIDYSAMIDMENGSQQVMGTTAGYFVIWLIGLIPCVAITGPSSAGAAYIMRNWARDEHAFIFSDYKDAFKGNWKQALPVSVLTSFLPIVLYTAVAYYSEMSSGNMLMIVPMVFVIFVALMWTLMLPLLYPLMIGYELRLKDVIKNAFLIATARLPYMALSRLITLIPVLFFFIGLYIGNTWILLIVSAYYLFFGFAFSRLVYASFANAAFDKYLNPHIDGAKVNQGLRPHTDEDDILDEDEDEEDEEVADDDDD